MEKNHSDEQAHTLFYTPRIKCIHRLLASDIPRGIDSDDLTLDCEDDPQCPESKSKK